MEPIRPSSRRWRIPIVLCCLSGCALSISGPEPNRPRSEFPKCDTGKTAVVADGVLATIAGVASLAAFANDESGVGLTSLAIGALFLGSAVRGNNAAQQCRAAFEDYRLATQQPIDPERSPTRPPRNQPLATPAMAQPIAPLPDPQPRVVSAPTVASPPVTNQPPVTQPAVPQPPATLPPAVQPTKPAKPRLSENDWSEFWKEVP